MSMDLYRFGLYCGFTGMVSMAALSFLGHLGHGHGGHEHSGLHHGHHGGHGHVGGHHGGPHDLPGHHTPHAHHTPVHHEAGGHAHSHHHSHGHHGHHESGGFRLSDWFAIFLSPRVWFSVMLGFGAAGVLLRDLAPMEPLRFLLAACGGIGFEKFMVAPLWAFWFRFAGESHTLESAVAEEAQAVTDFDASGHGLIKVTLDGQVVQMLAKLSHRALENEVGVRSGDTVLVEDIDTRRQSAVVSPLTRL